MVTRKQVRCDCQKPVITYDSLVHADIQKSIFATFKLAVSWVTEGAAREARVYPRGLGEAR
jgi:hypothetical protein